MIRKTIAMAPWATMMSGRASAGRDCGFMPGRILLLTVLLCIGFGSPALADDPPGVCRIGDDLYFSSVQDAVYALEAEDPPLPDNIVLLTNYTAASTIAISKGTEEIPVTLDLAGHTLTGCGSASVITVNGGAYFKLMDSSEDGTGIITQPEYSNIIKGAGVLNETDGHFIMERGSITNCNTVQYGGGVYNNGTFTMNGGSITDCSAVSNGGGVYNDVGGVMRISGSPIVIGNTKTTSKATCNVYLRVSYLKYIIQTGDFTGSIGITPDQMTNSGSRFGTVEKNPDNRDYYTGAENFFCDINNALSGHHSRNGVLEWEKVGCQAGPEHPFTADRVGVCSWSWATNMTTIVEEMGRMGVRCMQLSLVPWVEPLGGVDYPESLRNAFGAGESGDVFAAISNKISRGEISVLSTMISFPGDRWESYEAISNSNGIVGCDASDPLGEGYWTVNSNLVDQAAAMTAALGVEYLTTEIGYLDKAMIDGQNRNADCAIGFERLFEVQRLCAAHGVKLLFESGQYSGEDTKTMIDRYVERYGDRELENGIRVEDIGINFDFANHLIYGNDNPTNAFAKLKGRIPQVHVKDSFVSLVDRESAGGFAVDVKWGTGDASRVFHTLEFLKAEGFSGNALVEHEAGTDRVGDIRAALKAILLANNDDPSDPWIDPAVMLGDDDERCGAALKAHGFPDRVAEKLSKTELYDAFRGWARYRDFDPDFLAPKQGVILAAGYDASDVPAPEDISLTIEDICVDDNSLSFTVCIDGTRAGFNPDSANQGLIQAGLTVLGTESLDSDFTTEGFSVEAGTLTGVSIPLTVRPESGSSFFVRVRAE